MSHYIFYDFETTGISHAYDQVLQFAAIVTDENLNEIEDATINIRCKLLPHIIPSPMALAVTNVSPDLLINEQRTHREFMHEIQEWAERWSPAIFWGYNSIKFDENMMRYGLYQTLHAPYLTNTNGNLRGDVMRLAHAAFLFNPDALETPLNQKNKPVFKLGIFAQANGIEFNEAEAHDALYDVRKTIEVADLIKQSVPEVWSAMTSNTRKGPTLEFIKNKNFFATGDLFFNNPYRWIMSYCGRNEKNPNQLAVFDLTYPPEDYINLTTDELIEVLGGSPKVIRSVKINAQPFTMDHNLVSETFWEKIDIDLEEAEQRALVIKENEQFQARVGEALANRFEDEEPSENVEEKIYDGFPSANDKTLMIKFHSSSPEERLAMIREFSDQRYQQIARRLVYADSPELLDDNTRLEMDAWVAERLSTNEDVPWRTLPEAFLELEDLKRARGESDDLLLEIEEYLTGIANRIAA